jgi:SPP1 family predicted phage head-tail adaptor
MIGKLRTRITFKSLSGTSDGAGGYVNTQSTYYTCWAEIVRQNQNKDNIALKDNLDDNITFRIRYTTSKNIDNKLIIEFKSKKYLINSVINEGDLNKYFLIGCATLL